VYTQETHVLPNNHFYAAVKSFRIVRQVGSAGLFDLVPSERVRYRSRPLIVERAISVPTRRRPNTEHSFIGVLGMIFGGYRIDRQLTSI